jgi:hypothetical protein
VSTGLWTVRCRQSSRPSSVTLPPVNVKIVIRYVYLYMYSHMDISGFRQHRFENTKSSLTARSCQYMGTR